MLPLRLVIDTNVVISAALKPKSIQRTALLFGHNKTRSTLCIASHS